MTHDSCLECHQESTLSLVRDQWDTFGSQYEKGQAIAAQIEAEEQELAALERRLDDSDPDAFLPPLVSHLETHQTLLTAHSVSDHTVTLLSALVSFHSTIATLADSITSGQLHPAALEHLRESIQAVESGAEEWIEDTDVWKGLVKWQSDEQSRLETALQNTFESAFEFSLPPPSAFKDSIQHPSTSLVLCSELRAAPKGPTLSLSDVMTALDEFSQLTGRQSKVEGLLARVSKQVLRGFVAPFLEANGTVEWQVEVEEDGDTTRKNKLAFSYSEGPSKNSKKVILGAVDVEEGGGESDPIAALAEFLAFFTTHSSLFPSSGSTSRYTSFFTASLTPSVQSHVITSHLVPSLPSSTGDLTRYISLLDRATTFESEFLPSRNLFAFLPPSTSSQGSVEESHILSTWAKSLPQHYARALGERALARVRNQVKNWDWANPQGGEMVDVEVREEEEMEGLLRGLELGLNEEDAQGGTGGSFSKEQKTEDKETKRRTELETVPKGAKREMTLEEALAPRPPRAVTPPPLSPPPPREPTPPIRLATPPAAQSTGRKNKLKLGASKITNSSVPFLPPKSPSPPPMFQGDDLQLPTPSIATTTLPPSPEPASVALPPISTSTSAVQLDPLASQQHNRSNSRSSSAGGHGTPILSPRPISIPSAASFTHAVEHSDEEQVHEIVERAQRTIAEEGKDIFEPLEEVRTQGVPEMVVGERELEKEIEIKSEEEAEELARSEGASALTMEALGHVEQFDEDEKPFIKQEDDDEEAQAVQAPNESIIDHFGTDLSEVKQEEDDERSVLVKEEEQSNELETTPQIGDVSTCSLLSRARHSRS